MVTKIKEDEQGPKEGKDASINEVVSKMLKMFVPKRQQNKRKDFLKSSIKLVPSNCLLETEDMFVDTWKSLSGTLGDSRLISIQALKEIQLRV